MAQPQKPNTRSTSAAAFQHIFSLFDSKTTVPIIEALDEVGIDTIIDLLAEDPTTFDTYTYTTKDLIDHDLTKKQLRTLKMIHSWLRWECKNRPDKDYTTMVMNDYDEFLNTLAIGGSMPTPTPTPVLTVTSAPPQGHTIIPPVSAFASNVKLDVKTYPVFNGEINNWSRFKRGVLALAATHELNEIFDAKTVVPSPGDSN